MTPTLIMLIGLPGSGKTALADEVAASSENMQVFSSDRLREELYGDVNEQSKNDDVFKELHKRIKVALQNGIDCIYDATNINGKYRKAFLDELKNIRCYKVAVVVAVPYEECVRRNNERERCIPEDVIRRMYLNFQPPYYHEGWDAVQVYCNFEVPNENYSIYHAINRMDGFDQKNTHHTFTLGDHCKKCARYIHANYPKRQLLLYAASLHDYGKIFTQSRLNSKGEFDGNYHYYQHHCTGAYDSIMIMYGCGFEDCDILYISNLIYYHMHPYMSWKQSDKAKEKDYKLLGDEMFEDILRLHEGDLYAH